MEDKECKFCDEKATFNGGEVITAVDAYVIDNEVVYVCGGCLVEHTNPETRRRIHLPDGWEIIPSDVARELGKVNEAFYEAHDQMSRSAKEYNIHSGYVYDMGGFFNRIVGYVEKKLSDQKASLKSIGIKNDGTLSDFNNTCSRCPNCQSPMIFLQAIKDKYALAVLHDSMRYEKHWRDAAVCLGCSRVYIERKN